MSVSGKIEVIFIDGRTGTVLGTNMNTPDQLPASFLHATTLTLGDQQWSVDNAEPPTRAQYMATGRLVLTLAKIEKLDPEKIDPESLLYSLATINDSLPGCAGEADGSEVVLTEDDWRQIELVHASLRRVIDEEVRDIRRIHAAYRSGLGFKKVHVRTRLPDPMPGVKLELDTLATLDLAPDHLLRFDRYGVRVDGGFARSLSGGWFLYGAATAGTVKTLALQPCAKALPDPAAVAALEDLAQRHGLLLVDWCRCAIGEPGTKSFVHVIAGPQ